MKDAWPRSTRTTDRGAVPQFRDDPIGDSVEIVDEIPFGRTRAFEQRLVEVRQLNAVTHLIFAHRIILHLPPSLPVQRPAVVAPARCVLSVATFSVWVCR
jgi:hypothetical protein